MFTLGSLLAVCLLLVPSLSAFAEAVLSPDLRATGSLGALGSFVYRFQLYYIALQWRHRRNELFQGLLTCEQTVACVSCVAVSEHKQAWLQQC